MAQRRLFGLLHSMHWSRAKSITVEAPKVAWTCCHDSRAALAGKRWMHSLSSVWYIIKRNSYAVQRSYAKKAAKSQKRLNEEEAGVIDLGRLESSMQAAIAGLTSEFTNTVIARITPATLDRVTVEIDGQRYPLKAVAQIGMPNPSLIVVNLSSYPEAVNDAVNALRSSELNLNPIPEKNVIKVPIPKMSKELRERLVKVAKASAEKTKVGIRKARQKGITDIKIKDDVSKDTVRKLEKHIQQLTDDFTDKVDEMLKAKNNELTQGT